MTLSATEAAQAKAIGETIQWAVEKACKPLLERIEKLEQRGWKGDYQKALAYPAQCEVRHKHATWVSTCDIPPGEVPGEGNTGWQLKHKAETPPRLPTQPRTTNGFHPGERRP